MSQGSTDDRKRVILPLLVLFVFVLLFLLLRKPAPTNQTKAAPQASDKPKVTYGVTQRKTISSANPAPSVKAPKKQEKEPPPIIDEVIIEKSEVCSGEENLITVKAHTTNETDEYLHYTIAGGTGASVPVRAYLNDEGVAPKQKIIVFGRNNVATEMDIPEYKVKDCKPLRNLFVQHRLQPNTWGDYVFEAKVLEVGSKTAPDAKPFKPTQYIWDFGDGVSISTDVPTATHSFEGRSQSSHYSMMLVSVDAFDPKSGEHVIGRTSMQVMNPAFEDFAFKQIVGILIELNPRFPVLNSDGIVEQGVRLWHLRDEPVTINKVFSVVHYAGGVGNAPPQPEDVSKILGTTIIPPGRGIETVVRLNVKDNPEIFSVNYLLEGVSVEGYLVRGGFSVMQPPAKPTKENSIPVYDPVLTAKIKAAREILGKEVVTDEDIWQLEREGKLENLKVEPVEEPPDEPPPNLPPRGEPPKVVEAPAARPEDHEPPKNPPTMPPEDQKNLPQGDGKSPAQTPKVTKGDK